MYQLLFFGLLTVSVFGEIPSSVLAEQDLQKRSELALQEADEEISAAAKAYAPGAPTTDFEKHLADAGELAQLSLKSLRDSGKSARKQPKYFKRAELKLRGLLRRLDSLEKDVLVDDRPPVKKAKSVFTEVHEQILLDIMSPK